MSKPAKSIQTSATLDALPGENSWMVSSVMAAKRPARAGRERERRHSFAFQARSPPRMANSVKWASFRRRKVASSTLGPKTLESSSPTKPLTAAEFSPGRKELPQIKPNQARVRIPASNFLLFVECFMLFSTF